MRDYTDADINDQGLKYGEQETGLYITDGNIYY